MINETQIKTLELTNALDRIVEAKELAEAQIGNVHDEGFKLLQEEIYQRRVELDTFVSTMRLMDRALAQKVIELVEARRVDRAERKERLARI